jgi:hypothetical protein
MLYLSLALFAVAALLGLTVAVALFKKRETSKPVALAHGVVAAAGLIVLIVHAAATPARLLTIAIVLLVVAALGGVVLFANDVRRQPGPLALVIIHAVAAVTAVVLVALVAA